MAFDPHAGAVDESSTAALSRDSMRAITRDMRLANGSRTHSAHLRLTLGRHERRAPWRSGTLKRRSLGYRTGSGSDFHIRPVSVDVIDIDPPQPYSPPTFDVDGRRAGPGAPQPHRCVQPRCQATDLWSAEQPWTRCPAAVNHGRRSWRSERRWDPERPPALRVGGPVMTGACAGHRVLHGQGIGIVHDTPRFSGRSPDRVERASRSELWHAAQTLRVFR